MTVLLLRNNAVLNIVKLLGWFRLVRSHLYMWIPVECISPSASLFNNILDHSYRPHLVCAR